MSEVRVGSCGSVKPPVTLTGLPHIADVIGEGISVADCKAVDFCFWDEAALCGALAEKAR